MLQASPPHLLYQPYVDSQDRTKTRFAARLDPALAQASMTAVSVMTFGFKPLAPCFQDSELNGSFTRARSRIQAPRLVFHLSLRRKNADRQTAKRGRLKQLGCPRNQFTASGTSACPANAAMTADIERRKGGQEVVDCNSFCAHR